MTGLQGEIRFADLYEANPNDLVMSALLPTHNTQVDVMMAFEEALNKVYGKPEKDIKWAKENLFGIRNSEVFVRVNDIEKEALLYLLQEKP
ncbi:MAG: hypothetical protein SGJ00_10245 [bacterium]|nr:hypothetical protein [bacterium]